MKRTASTEADGCKIDGTQDAEEGILAQRKPTTGPMSVPNSVRRMPWLFLLAYTPVLFLACLGWLPSLVMVLAGGTCIVIALYRYVRMVQVNEPWAFAAIFTFCCAMGAISVAAIGFALR
jgi:hypothetical protein